MCGATCCGDPTVNNGAAESNCYCVDNCAKNLPALRLLSVKC